MPRPFVLPVSLFALLVLASLAPLSDAHHTEPEEYDYNWRVVSNGCFYVYKSEYVDAPYAGCTSNWYPELDEGSISTYVVGETNPRTVSVGLQFYDRTDRIWRTCTGASTTGGLGGFFDVAWGGDIFCLVTGPLLPGAAWIGQNHHARNPTLNQELHKAQGLYYVQDEDGVGFVAEILAGSDYNDDNSRPETDDDNDGTENRHETALVAPALCSGAYGFVAGSTCTTREQPPGCRGDRTFVCTNGAGHVWVWHPVCGTSGNCEAYHAPDYAIGTLPGAHGWYYVGDYSQSASVTQRVYAPCHGQPYKDTDGDGIYEVRVCHEEWTISTSGSIQRDHLSVYMVEGDPDDNDPSYPIPVRNGPYADVHDDGPDCSGRDTIYIERLGGTITFRGTPYGAIVEDACIDAGQLPMTLTYPQGVRAEADGDGDGAPAGYTITQARLILQEDGTVTGPEAAADGPFIPVDPNDVDACAPTPQVTHQDADVQRDATTGAVRIQAAITVCHALGTTSRTVDETTIGPFPREVDDVPTGSHWFEDADGDRVPVVYAEFATLVLHADGSHAFRTGTTYEVPLGGDADDADPTTPLPTATASVSARIGCEADTACVDAGGSATSGSQSASENRAARANAGEAFDAVGDGTGHRPASLGPDAVTVHAPPAEWRGGIDAITLGTSVQGLNVGGLEGAAGCDAPATASWAGVSWSGLLNGGVAPQTFTEPTLVAQFRCALVGLVPSEDVTVSGLPSVDLRVLLP